MSILKTIIYNTADQNVFGHDSNEVLIDSNGATLKKLGLLPDEMLMANGKMQADADRAIDGNVAIFLNGDASWDEANQRYDLSNSATLNNISLNDDSGRDGINPLTPTSHFNFQDTGCIRFKAELPYTGFPSGDKYIFSTGNSIINNGLGSRFDLLHSHTTGNISVIAFSSVGTGQAVKVFGAWAPVAGTKYEFELNINGATAEFYINGVLFGNVTGLHTGLSRDYFNFGTDYTRTLRSEIYLSDIQIFDEIQHTSDFSSEIPRIVNIYPLESKITPVEITEVKGIEQLSHSVTLTGDSGIKYTAKINGVEYYLVAGVITESDGTYSQSSSVSEWVAAQEALTDFVSSGAELIMLPILSSGAFGIYNPLLISTTLAYIFFNIPESLNKCLVHFEIYDPSGDPIEGAKVTIEINDFWYGEAFIVRQKVGFTDVNGKGSLEIVETQTNTATATIIIKYAPFDSRVYRDKTIPNKSKEALAVIIA